MVKDDCFKTDKSIFSSFIVLVPCTYLNIIWLFAWSLHLFGGDKVERFQLSHDHLFILQYNNTSQLSTDFALSTFAGNN